MGNVCNCQLDEIPDHSDYPIQSNFSRKRTLQTCIQLSQKEHSLGGNMVQTVTIPPLNIDLINTAIDAKNQEGKILESRMQSATNRQMTSPRFHFGE